MKLPIQYRYSKEHTWLHIIDGASTLVGITDHAQNELGEIVYIDLPAPGKSFAKDEVFGSVEALKTTSDLFMPIAGEVQEINPLLKDNPTLVNTDPFGKAWMLKIKILHPHEADSLLDDVLYQAFIG